MFKTNLSFVLAFHQSQRSVMRLPMPITVSCCCSYSHLTFGFSTIRADIFSQSIYPSTNNCVDDQSKIIKEDQNEITWCIFSKHQLLCICCNVPQLFLFHCFSYKELISKLCTVQNAPTLYLGLHPTSLSTLSIVHMLSHYILKGYHGW